VGADEFHQDAAERVRHMHDQPVLVASEVEDRPVVADEIDRSAELPLVLARIAPARPADRREPDADRNLGLRVALPERAQRSASDHLHQRQISMSPIW
jgi:hypothetical protein